jgi:hypothetical protein
LLSFRDHIAVPVDETVVKYPTLAPDTHGVGNSSGYNFPNSSGFTYQAEAVHRCLAAGLLECPQYTQEESLCVTKILDGAQSINAAQPRRARVRVALLKQLSAGRCKISSAAYICVFSYTHAGIQTALEAQASPIAAPNPVFDGQLPSMPSAAMTGSIVDPSTPMDIKMGLTNPGDVAHTLRWGFMTAGRICKDMVSALWLLFPPVLPFGTLLTALVLIFSHHTSASCNLQMMRVQQI